MRQELYIEPILIGSFPFSDHNKTLIAYKIRICECQFRQTDKSSGDKNFYCVQ